MQIVVIRFTVREEWAGRRLDVVGEFTRATRAEDSNLWFWWARGVDEPNVFFLLEGHREWPVALVETPRVLMTTLPGNDWPELALLPVPSRD